MIYLLKEIMKPSLFNENDSVLLVGEGNFSFSVALFQLNLKIKIVATCYESAVDQCFGKKNIEYLENNGVRVILGIDATKLTGHQVLNTMSFNKIIFNFPHIGRKMKINKNRELLKQFFISASELLPDDGVAIVTLCNGQGGTLFDHPPRRWDDSWKVTEMAAHGNFILNTVQLFAWSLFQNYIVTGYRSLDKQFHTDDSLTHIFIKSKSPDVYNIAPKNKIHSAQFNGNAISWKQIYKVTDTLHRDKCDMHAHTYIFDITLRANRNFDSDHFYVLLYNNAGLIINNVDLIDVFKSSENMENRTYRISYKSGYLPLFRKRVIDIHQNIIADILEKGLNVIVPR